jgi:hypothetical protein
MLKSLSTRSREIIPANMRQLASVTLGILMSLYPQADLDTTGDSFAATCSKEEALKLIEDSAVTVGQLILRVFPPCSYTIMNGNYMHKFLTCIVRNYPFELFLPSNMVTKTSN